MNPVEIWEGIDTQEETGRNRLTKLAIHILSVVANSAGCERAFSHMGLVHTGIRSKLGVENSLFLRGVLNPYRSDLDFQPSRV